MSSTASSSTSTSTSIPSPFPSDPSSIPDALTAEEECRLLRSIFPRSVLDTANSPQESSGCCQLPFDFPLGSIPTSPFILIDDDAFNTSFKALQGDPRNVLCYSLERSPGRISFLRIRNVALNITTPSQLAALTRLKHLEISNASLTGPIPDSWGTFPMLENLYLVQNQFNAPLNPALAQLPRLQNFYVHSSGLTGEIHPAFSRVFGTNGTMVRFGH
ncbi:hypothetical protein BC829DRAFT_293033 [Chytridium lagenaria]|nr:hypothetical protein BC829DRAFT_293033 [Chytridium lagenaria]